MRNEKWHTCFPAQLLPKGNNGESRSKKDVGSWSQYPDID